MITLKLPGTSRTVAVVTFIGYEDDGQEAFNISKLKKPQNERSKNFNGKKSLVIQKMQHLNHNIQRLINNYDILLKVHGA